MLKKQRAADIRVVGTKSQISDLLTMFSAKGFAWQSNGHFYPRIGQPGFFSYYLDNFEYEVLPPQNLAREGFQSVSATDQP